MWRNRACGERHIIQLCWSVAGPTLSIAPVWHRESVWSGLQEDALKDYCSVFRSGARWQLPRPYFRLKETPDTRVLYLLKKYVKGKIIHKCSRTKPWLCTYLIIWSLKCLWIVKNFHHAFLKPSVTSSGVLFCSTSVTPSIMLWSRERLKSLLLDNSGSFCWYEDKWIIEIDLIVTSLVSNTEESVWLYKCNLLRKQ